MVAPHFSLKRLFISITISCIAAGGLLSLSQLGYEATVLWSIPAGALIGGSIGLLFNRIAEAVCFGVLAAAFLPYLAKIVFLWFGPRVW